MFLPEGYTAQFVFLLFGKRIVQLVVDAHLVNLLFIFTADDLLFITDILKLSIVGQGLCLIVCIFFTKMLQHGTFVWLGVIVSRIFGNLYLSWPKLFNTFSHILTSFFVHKCIHSIITHQYMSKLCILMENLNF